MKYLILISFAFNYSFYFCQSGDSIQFDHSNERSFVNGWTSSNTLFSLEYGVSKFQLNALNDAMKTSSSSTFSDYLGCIVASYSSTFLVSRKFAMDSHLDYMYFHSIPSVLEINDSSRYFTRGFHIGFDGCKDLFPRHQNVDLLLGLGFNAGRFMFAHWNPTIDDKLNRKNKYTNPFFAPKLVIEPRFILSKHFAISIRAELQLDVTNQGWTRRNNNLSPIGRSAATGYNLRLTLGWRD